MEIKIVIDDRIIRGFKRVFNKRIMLPAGIVFSLMIGLVAIAATIPNTFESGITISSSEMNGNFAYIISRLWDRNEDNELYYDAGNVGIGTSEPEATLDVIGNVDVDGNLAVTGNTGVTGNTVIDGDLTVSGNLNASGMGGFTYDNAAAAASSMPSGTYEDLDLSSRIGSNRAMVFLKMTSTCIGSASGPHIYVRSKEDTMLEYSLDGMCMSMGDGYSETKFFWIPTDTTGMVEWRDDYGGASHSVEVYAVGYVK
jgi:hypothetical protein